MTILVLSTSCMVGTDGDDEDAAAGQALDEPADPAGTTAARICANGPTVLGIDVSHHQGNIDWVRVKNANVVFAYIRVSDGVNTRDRKFAANWAGAKSAGVIRGVYQFFRPSQSVAAQAQIMIDAIGTKQPGDLPPVIDVEVDGGLSPATVAARVRDWIGRVQAATGVTPVIYTAKYFWRDEVGNPVLTNPLWIANYTPKCPDIPTAWPDWTIWQQSATARVPGITGDVDLNFFNGTPDQLAAFTR